MSEAVWSGRRDSNPRPSACHSGGLAWAVLAVSTGLLSSVRWAEVESPVAPLPLTWAAGPFVSQPARPVPEAGNPRRLPQVPVQRGTAFSRPGKDAAP